MADPEEAPTDWDAFVKSLDPENPYESPGAFSDAVKTEKVQELLTKGGKTAASASAVFRKTWESLKNPKAGGAILNVYKNEDIPVAVRTGQAVARGAVNTGLDLAEFLASSAPGAQMDSEAAAFIPKARKAVNEFAVDPILGPRTGDVAELAGEELGAAALTMGPVAEVGSAAIRRVAPAVRRAVGMGPIATTGEQAARSLPRLAMEETASAAGTGIGRHVGQQADAEGKAGFIGSLLGTTTLAGIRGGLGTLANRTIPGLRTTTDAASRISSRIGDKESVLRNLEAGRQEHNVGGFDPTLGAVANDPGMSALEQELIARNPSFASEIRNRIDNGRRDLTERLSALGGSPDADVTHAVTNIQADVDAVIGDAKRTLDEMGVPANSKQYHRLLSEHLSADFQRKSASFEERFNGIAFEANHVPHVDEDLDGVLENFDDWDSPGEKPVPVVLRPEVSTPASIKAMNTEFDRVKGTLISSFEDPHPSGEAGMTILREHYGSGLSRVIYKKNGKSVGQPILVTQVEEGTMREKPTSFSTKAIRDELSAELMQSGSPKLSSIPPRIKATIESWNPSKDNPYGQRTVSWSGLTTLRQTIDEELANLPQGRARTNLTRLQAKVAEVFDRGASVGFKGAPKDLAQESNLLSKELNDVRSTYQHGAMEESLNPSSPTSVEGQDVVGAYLAPNSNPKAASLAARLVKVTPAGNDSMDNAVMAHIRDSIVDSAGVVDSMKLARYRATHSVSLGQFPNVDRKLENILTAQRAYEDLGMRGSPTRPQIQRSTLAAFADDYQATIKGIVTKNDVRASSQFINRFNGNPDALAGYRRELWYELTKDVNTSSGEGIRGLIETKGNLIRSAYGDTHIGNLEKIAGHFDTLSRQLGPRAPGSVPTSGAAAALEGSTLSLMANRILGGPMKTIRGIKILNKFMDDLGSDRIRAVLEEAYLNPQLAERIIRRVTPQNEEALVRYLATNVLTLPVRTQSEEGE